MKTGLEVIAVNEKTLKKLGNQDFEKIYCFRIHMRAATRVRIRLN